MNVYRISRFINFLGADQLIGAAEPMSIEALLAARNGGDARPGKTWADHAV